MLSVSSIADYEKKVAILEKSIVSVPNFPKEGILFRDITTLLEDPIAFRTSIELLRDMCSDEKPDYIVAADARGFLFGAALSYELGLGLVLVRKKGKLP
ncbi:MAG: adenine phosphoribosyltransferase, partial [Succinivibrio sp.]